MEATKWICKRRLKILAYDNTCPECGAYLDPCEKCDCEIRKEESGNEKKNFEKTDDESKT